MKKIKKAIILLLAIVNCQLSIVNAQTLSPKVTPAAGNSSVNAGVNISSTFGEAIISTQTSGGITLSQGFEQPEVNLLTGTV